MHHRDREVTGGVDTHGDVHVAAVIDSTARILGTESFDATPTGYKKLLAWMRRHGRVVRVGIEGTGSFGAGLARYLAGEGVTVVEVNRPDRQRRRRRGKTHTVDAESAARAALSGDATGQPKSADGRVEAVRVLRLARRSAIKARTQAANQIRDLIITAPDQLRGRLRKLSTQARVDTCARVDHDTDPLRPLLAVLANLGPGEAACVQVLARPATGRRLTAAYQAASARRSGRPASRLARILDLATPGPAATPASVDPTRERDVRAILDKAARPSWAITIRYAVSTTAAHPQAKARLRGRAHALASAFALYAGRNRLDRHRLLHPARAMAGRRLGRGDLVSIGELAALAHLPTDVAVAGLARAGAKPVPPPPGVPTTGKVLGDSETATSRPVAVSVPMPACTYTSWAPPDRASRRCFAGWR